MFEMRNSRKRFEEICFDILRHYVETLETNIRTNFDGSNYEIDALVKNPNGRKAIIEIKWYRNTSVNLKLIESALEQLYKNSYAFDIPNMALITSVKLDAYYKQAFELNYGVNIIDIENLLFLSNNIPNTKNDLIELLRIKSDNENEIKGVEYDFSKIFDSKISRDIYSGLTYKSMDINKGELLYQELEKIKPGKRAFADYENKCTDILKYLFGDSLDGWHKQQRTDDGLNRFDLICRITSNDGIWSIFNKDFQSRYLLFEFKNYQEEITQNQVYTTEKYLFVKALRNVAMIISRNGASENALKACDGVLKESGKVILNISNHDISKMLRMKDSGTDPTDYLFDILDEMLLKLSK